MKIAQESIPYLKGDKFTNSHTFSYSGECDNVDRITYLENLCRNKKVIHIGFADHLPLVPKKMEDNTWLHKRLTGVSAKIVGVDVDLEAIQYFSKNYSIPDIYLHDIINDAPLPAIIGEQWDCMILGEILEHVDNPVQFLKQLQEKYGAYAKEIIITVPNAMNLMSIRMAKNNKEFINSDHRYWFTPFTLAKIGFRAGWEPDEFFYSQTNMPGRWIFKKIIQKYPAYRETLIMTMKSPNYI